MGIYGHLYPNTNRAVADKLTNLVVVSQNENSERALISNQHIKRDNTRIGKE